MKDNTRPTFGSLLREARQRAKAPESRRAQLSQQALADLIAEQLGTPGSPTQATIGYWENGKHKPAADERKLLIALIQALVNTGGLTNVEMASELLVAGNYAALSKDERQQFGLSSNRPKQNQATQVVVGTAPPLPALLIGRDSDLSKLKHRVGISQPGLGHGSIKVLTAMRGWPGVGKTSLAAALAHDTEIAARFPDGVLWASLGQRPNVLFELVKWGWALGITELQSVKTIGEASQLLTGALRTKQMLLIVDDVWEIQDFLPFRIGGVGSALLLTTRLPEVARKIAPAADDVYVLGVLDPSNGLALLRALAPTVVETEEEECRQLVADLEGLPLALQVAGRLLHVEAGYNFGVTELLRKLREGAALIEAQAPIDRTDIANQTTPTVAALLELSTSKLDEVAINYFAYLGAFAPKPASFDYAAIKSVWDLPDPQPLLRVFIDRGLLEPVEERYWMHSILVAHAKSFWEQGSGQ